jgi:glucose dehydrogenase
MEKRTRRSVLIAAFSVGAASAGVGAIALRRHLRAPKPEYGMPEFEGPEARLSEVLDAPPFDVCIVGSGPAGAVLGLQLAQSGIRTVILEAGVTPSRLAKDERYSQLNVATQSGDHPYALTATRALMPGGTSSLWTGNTPRLLPIDFEQNAYTPAGTGWPVTYAHMNDYYERAEESLHVTGESNVRYVAPRSHALPDQRRGGNRALKAMLAKVGVVSFDTFRSRGPTGGPVRVARDILPSFARLPDAAFVSGITVRWLLGSAPDRISGALVRDMDGNESTVRARVFVLATGAVECARRLLLSRSEHFPDGLGNRFDQVGRTFADHLYCNFTSTIADHHVFLGGPMPQVVRSFQFYEVFKRKGLGSVGLTAALRETEKPGLELSLTGECELEPSPANRVTLDEAVTDVFGDPVAHLHFSASERDVETKRQMCDVIYRLATQMNAYDVQQLPPHWGHHHLGVVRMGHNERTSVVDANLKLHGVRNAYAITSGNFVTSGPANPTLLIVALAHRLAEHVIARMREGAYEASPAQVKA